MDQEKKIKSPVFTNVRSWLKKTMESSEMLLKLINELNKDVIYGLNVKN